MKTVFEAANAIEAHMLQDLLRQQGITAHIHGEFLPGAAGDLPAAGLVRVVVDDDDFARAREAVTRWESTAAEPTPTPPRQAKGWFLPALAGLAVGIAGTIAFMRVPVQADGVDYNGDGVPDERMGYSASGTLLTVKTDRNFDGKVDYEAHYNRRGWVESTDNDDDFDGRFETHCQYKMGNVDWCDVDTDGDTLPNLRTRFKGGVSESMAYIDAHTGRPFRVEHFVLGRVVSVEVDTDGDGTLDQRITYSARQEAERTERIEPR